MKKINLKKLAALTLAVLLTLSLAACGSDTGTKSGTAMQSSSQSKNGNEAANTQRTETAGSQSTEAAGSQSTEAAYSQKTEPTEGSTEGILDTSDLFTQRDQEQTAELDEAVSYHVIDGKDIKITEEGVYTLTGTASNVTVCVEAGDEDKVQLVLDGLNVTNDDSPVIYVKNADKVFVTTREGSENSLSVTGTFTEDGSTNTDAVIFSRDDLVFNGLGSLRIDSTDNGISSKDDIKITGGTLEVTAQDHGIEANDSIAVEDGVITVTSRQKDGLHAENEDDDKEGWITICGGTLNINAADDGIHAVSICQIDGGVLNVTAAEGIEATQVQINDGEITINASDDGINGGQKSKSYSVCIEIHGGNLSITMGQGDTDGIDSNGDLVITGGIISVNAQSPFDYDGTLTHTGGTIIVNGTETTQITNQFGGGGPGGGHRP